MVTIPDDEKEAIPIVAPILTVNVSDNICPVFAIPVNAEPSNAGNAPVKLLAARAPLNVVAVTTPV